MKVITVEPLRTLGGQPLLVPAMDTIGSIIMSEAGVPESKVGTLEDILKLFVLQFPRQSITQQDALHGARLYTQILASSNSKLTLEDAEYEWVTKRISSELGAQMFGMSLSFIEDALKKATDGKAEGKKDGKKVD